MITRLQQNEEEVLIEKEKVRTCRATIKKSIDSLFELINGTELSEEKEVELIEPTLSLGGTDVKPE